MQTFVYHHNTVKFKNVPLVSSILDFNTTEPESLEHITLMLNETSLLWLHNK